ncbi:transcription factor TFIIIB component B''-like [Lotus japonicus]|uniref:transcription factor TFIIIB component B''-like n=1 Tax=Lotus japonicus TaxID=34305 RepID=UPI002582726B|nr:transcription factor TFIIIB component B''-like [Lotus japonicus]XP_057450170.1 transcription factor TFIIIB component B''-like [Lotus japonicus]
MDAFDDILSGAPAPRARRGSKFMPKAKLKQLPQKEISASEHATSSKDGENVPVASSATSTKSGGILNECHDAVASTLSTSAEDSIRSNHRPQEELSNLEDATKSASEGLEAGLVTNSIPETNLNNGAKQPIHPANAVENENTVAAQSTTNSSISRMEEPPKSGEGSIPDSNKNLEHIDNSVPVIPDANFKSALENNAAVSGESEWNPFSDALPDPGTRNARKFQPKIKPRPRVSIAPAIASASSSDMMEKSTQLHVSCTNEVQSFQFSGDGICGQNTFSEDKRNMASVTPSQPDSLNAMPSEVTAHDGTRDSASSFGKPAPDNLTTQDPLTLNEAAVFEEDDTHTNIRRLETEEVVDLNTACSNGGVFDYQSIDSATDPTSEIPVNEELTNAADCPTLADVLHKDVTVEKEVANGRKKDSSLRKHRRSTAGEEDKGGKTARQLRKSAAREPANSSLNKDVDDDGDIDPLYNYNIDELEENDDEDELDYSSKKKTTSTSSKKKSVAKNEKTSQKRKKSNDDLENTTKKSLKKFSHSTLRRKRCEDLLKTPEDEWDPRNMPIKDIIILAEYKERLAKKDPTTSKTSSTNQSGGDPFYEAGANYEEGFFGSENPNDNQDTENVTDTTALINYQSFMDKAPRGKWSKQDTELFYEAVREFGTDFSMIQQLFPDRTRHQIKLKYKKEERQHPLQLSDAVNSRSKDLSHFKKVIERLQQASDKAEQDANEDVEDLTPETNEEVATTEKDTDDVETTKQDTNVKDQEDSAAIHDPEQPDNDDDDEDYSQIWSYTSEF